MSLFKKTILILVFLFVSFFIPIGFYHVSAADSENQIMDFFIEPGFDVSGRQQVQAVLKKVSARAYFYIEKDWYEALNEEEKNKTGAILTILGQEFDNKIYPQLTSIFGSEWKPGIDNDERITILFHSVKEGAAGYFRTQDEAPRPQAARSNEREMVYLNANFLPFEITKSLVAHEFTHLIEYNQKERLKGVEEEFWLSELRAEYVSTLLGYDNNYSNSNLQSRVKLFLNSPNDSLAEWQNQPSDYGVISIFGEYLVDHYGVKVLADSLQSSKKGILSLDEALSKNGAAKNFSAIFTDWTIAVFLNNCSLGQYYCYKNSNLKNLKIAPSLILLPATQKTEFSLGYTASHWSGNWYRIMGGKGDLEVQFSGDTTTQFQVPYVLCKENNDCVVNNLQLDNLRRGKISLADFNKTWVSLTIIPSVQAKFVGFDGKEAVYPFTIFAQSSDQRQEQELIIFLQARIEELKAQIALIQSKLVALQQKKAGSCQAITKNLFLGDFGEQVKCLQLFFKSQGSEIYPEGLTTGFFGPATMRAVVRFQQKYAAEILWPNGLSRGTGSVGPSTIKKINSLLINRFGP